MSYTYSKIEEIASSSEFLGTSQQAIAHEIVGLYAERSWATDGQRDQIELAIEQKINELASIG